MAKGGKDPRVARTRAELEEHYETQLAMLRRRCDAYYQGDYFEARDVASILRKLLHDYGKSPVSVLKQLGTKLAIRYLDSRVHDNLAVPSARGAWPRTVLPYSPYSARYMHSFAEWWEEQSFHVVYKNVRFTRRELVLKIANEEGGDHVSEKIDERLAILKRGKSPSVMFSEGGPELRIHGFELASVCAIGEELLFSFADTDEERAARMHLPHCS